MLFPVNHNLKNTYGLSQKTVGRIIDKATEKHHGCVTSLSETELMEAIQDNHKIARFLESLFCCCSDSGYEQGDLQKLSLARQLVALLRNLTSNDTEIILSGEDKNGVKINMKLYNNPEDYHYTYLQIGNDDKRIMCASLQTLKGPEFNSPEEKQRQADDKKHRKPYQDYTFNTNNGTAANLEQSAAELLKNAKAAREEQERRALIINESSTTTMLNDTKNTVKKTVGKVGNGLTKIKNRF